MNGIKPMITIEIPAKSDRGFFIGHHEGLIILLMALGGVSISAISKDLGRQRRHIREVVALGPERFLERLRRERKALDRRPPSRPNDAAALAAADRDLDLVPAHVTARIWSDAWRMQQHLAYLAAFQAAHGEARWPLARFFQEGPPRRLADSSRRAPVTRADFATEHRAA